MQIIPNQKVYIMERFICSIEIIRDLPSFIAKIQNASGTYKEYRNDDFELLLTQVYEDLQEDMESTVIEE